MCCSADQVYSHGRQCADIAAKGRIRIRCCSSGRLSLLAPGSEWRLDREWFQRSALRDLLGEDAGLAEIHKLYRCHDRLLGHKQAVFDHLVGRWRDLFNISYDVLLYDLTSTYFEAVLPFRKGTSGGLGTRAITGRIVQIIIALVVTPEGLPLAYEVLPGNTADKTTLRGFLERIERQYGKARRIWLMDRGVPTEEVLAEIARPTRRCITWWARRRVA